MSGTEAPPDTGKDHERTLARWQMAVAVVTLIGGLLAIAVLVLNLSDDNGDDEAGPGTDTATSVTTTPTPTSTTPTTTTTTSSSSTTSPPPGIFHETIEGSPIPVREGYGVDLDSPESNWGVTASSSRDFYVTSGATSIGGNSSGDRDVHFAIVKGPPTFEECEAQTALQTVVELAQTIEGQHLCVQSSQGRWAYVHIDRIDQDADEMRFDMRVWKLPTDP